MGMTRLNGSYVSKIDYDATHSAIDMLQRRASMEGDAFDRTIMRLRQMYLDRSPDAYVSRYKIKGVWKEFRMDRFIPVRVPHQHGIKLELSIGRYLDSDFDNVALRGFDAGLLQRVADDFAERKCLAADARPEPVLMLAGGLRFVAAERTRRWKYPHGMKLMMPTDIPR